MAVATTCQTPGAWFHVRVHSGGVEASVTFPGPVRLDEAGAALLEANVHNALELALARYFPVTGGLPGAGGHGAVAGG